MCFSYFIAKQGATAKDICYSLNFFLFVPPVVWFTIDMQIGHLKDKDHVQMFLWLLCAIKFFRIFFPNTLIVNFHQETIAFWG